MLWVITGGCGFIGRNLIGSLLHDPATAVRIVDDLSVGTREDLAATTHFAERVSGATAAEGTRVELLVGDIRDPDLADRATAGADIVVHLAANTGVASSVSDPMYDCTTNVLGTLVYLEACRRNRVRRFVFASSGAPIGDAEPPLHEELAPHPVSPYGASKLAGEAYCSAYARSFEVETVALRFGNCYGPLSSHKSSLVAKFIRQAIAGEAWEIYGDGRQTRDFIFVEDVCRAIQQAATCSGVGGEVFQIATNTETTVLELAERLATVLRGKDVIVPPIRLAAARRGDVQRNYSDTRKARDRLGWTAQVDLEDGLQRTAAWFLRCRDRAEGL
jgi:UDP-glucose 4-epimerase